jgi:hypothetical protein
MTRRTKLITTAVVAVTIVAAVVAVLVFLHLARGRHVGYGDVPTWLTFVVAVVGIVGVVLQLQMLRKSTELLHESTQVQVYQSLIQNSSKIDEILIERPELRKYIYDSAAVPRSKRRQAEIESLIELAVDMIDNLTIQAEYVPRKAREGWASFAEDFLRQPTVVRFLNNHGVWYSGLSREGSKWDSRLREIWKLPKAESALLPFSRNE